MTLKSPAWNELSDGDRKILAPLASDWNTLDGYSPGPMILASSHSHVASQSSTA